jgi:hypothetical protein
MQKVTTYDDLTGQPTDADGAKSYQVKMGEHTSKLDLSPASYDALADLIAGNGADKLRALLAPVADATVTGKRPASATGATRTRTAKPGDSPAAKARAWATDSPAGKAWVTAQGTDYHVPQRGRATGLVAAWEAAGSPEPVAADGLTSKVALNSQYGKDAQAAAPVA